MNECFDHLAEEVREYREACATTRDRVFFYFMYNSMLKECSDYQDDVDLVFSNSETNTNALFFKEVNKIFKSDDLEWAKDQRGFRHLFTGRLVFPVPEGEHAERILIEEARGILEGKLRNLLERDLDVGSVYLDILNEMTPGIKDLYNSAGQGRTP
jgi:hypothetical protein